jgi:hypothetical protein
MVKYGCNLQVISRFHTNNNKTIGERLQIGDRYHATPNRGNLNVTLGPTGCDLGEQYRY